MPKRTPSERMRGVGDSHGKGPRALEDGNWVCEDPDCENVNYTWRTKCNKCGKSRGPVGDAVVDAYHETLKAARRKSPHRDGAPDPPQGMLEHTRSNMYLGSLSSVPSFINGHSIEPVPSFGSHYMTHDPSRISTASAVTEGKQLAEHLLASFAASPDPFGYAGEILSVAALWLQTMKSSLQIGGGPSFSLLGSPTFGGLSVPLGNGTLNVALQSQLGSSTGSTAKLGTGNMLTRPNSNPSGFHGPRALLRGSVKWEDYKDRPSDFLKEFGDPVAVTAIARGGSTKPEPGVNGNWECEGCKNVNFPRRTACHQCHKERGTKGDEIVRNYVRCIFEHMDGIRA